MNPIDLIFISTKTMKAYEAFCQPVCKKFQLNQTSFDVLMFLANNPKYNTARDICEIRGIRTGIASVAVDFLVSNGYRYDSQMTSTDESGVCSSQKKVLPSFRKVGLFSRNLESA